MHVVFMYTGKLKHTISNKWDCADGCSVDKLRLNNTAVRQLPGRRGGILHGMQNSEKNTKKEAILRYHQHHYH